MTPNNVGTMVATENEPAGYFLTLPLPKSGTGRCIIIYVHDIILLDDDISIRCDNLNLVLEELRNLEKR